MSHYKHAKSPQDYLLARCNKVEWGCWLFTGPLDKDGYGQVQSVKTAKALGVTRAHQMAYRTWVGNIPNGRFVCHTCDNPTCIRPDHLFLGTALENNQDMMKKGRAILPGAPRKINHSEVLKWKGKMASTKLCKQLGISFGTICKIWRKDDSARG